MRAIFTYHSIDSSGSAISVSEDVFRRHISWLVSGAVKVLPLDLLVAWNDESDAVAILYVDQRHAGPGCYVAGEKTNGSGDAIASDLTRGGTPQDV